MLKKLFGGKQLPAEIQHIPHDIGEPTARVPAISSPLRLQDGEVCCLALPATWARRQRGRRRYKGAGISIRLAKGAWLRGGGGQSDPELSVEKISEGQLFITSQRIVFHGNAKSTTIFLGDIADVQYGPDHFLLMVDNRQTEIFIVDQKLLSHERVRLLISRVWLLAREYGVDTVKLQYDEGNAKRPDLVHEYESAIAELSDAIESRSGSFDGDLELLQTIVSKTIEIESTDTLGDAKPRLYLEMARHQLIIRAMEDEREGNASPTETQSRLDHIREITKPISDLLTELEIFSEQRFERWPEYSSFDQSSGLGAQALELASELQSCFDPNIEDDEELLFESWNSQAQTRKMGSTICKLIFDGEALAIRSGGADISDATLFAYFAAISAAESYCVEHHGAEAWAAADEHTSLAVGAQKVEFIGRFLEELGEVVGRDIANSYREMESTIAEDIFRRIRPTSDPWSTYKAAIETAESYWVELINLPGSGGDNVELTSDAGSGCRTAEDEDIENRLDHIKALYDKGVISELEYQRQRQRILDEI